MAWGSDWKAAGSSSSGSSGMKSPVIHIILILLVVATLVVSSLALMTVKELKNAVTPKTISVEDFLKKLTTHNELKSYVGQAPLNIVQISNNNYGTLQTQINGLDISYVGSYIVQYSDRIVIYDYDKDQLRGTVNLQQQQAQQQAQLPADFVTKLSAHSELQGIQGQQPVGGQLDQASLNTLKQQFPDVYAKAKVGDFVLRYQTKLIIYDYNADLIVNSVNLS